MAEALGERGVAGTERLHYLDNLKVAAIALVIAHHVGQAYGPTGGYWPIQETERAALLGPFFTVNRSFGMSLFFMIAGYFTVMSYRSRGGQAFLKERVLRLGIPTLVFALINIALRPYFSPTDVPRASLLPLEVGHLWFLEHLLIFSAGYVLWDSLRERVQWPKPAVTRPPGYVTIVIVALALAAVTGVVRMWYPIDRWSYVFGFIRVMFADVPRDLTFYVIGVMACDRRWFQGFATRDGYVWLAIGLALAAFWYVNELSPWNLRRASPVTRDAVRLVWEVLLCFGMCIGLTVLFREKLNVRNQLSSALAQSQYAAYIFHPGFVLLFQALVVSLSWAPLAKFAVVTLAAVPASFVFGYWAGKPLRLQGAAGSA